MDSNATVSDFLFDANDRERSQKVSEVKAAMMKGTLHRTIAAEYHFNRTIL